MNYLIKHKSKIINNTIDLPASKSISNRVLIIQNLCKDSFVISNLSDAEDTKILNKNLNSSKTKLNVKDAGTAMRFLTALLATKNKEFIITGNKEMNKRPIGPLVKALNSLGANICYLKKKNVSPIIIRKSNLKGGEINIDSNISSQFISAILLIAPILKNGLIINLNGKIVSKSYIEMTLKIMSYFGIRWSWKKNQIVINEQEYVAKDISIENDWSSATFWMQLVALSKSAKINLKGLNKHSWQGDIKALDFFSNVGVEHKFKKNCLLIQKTNKISSKKIFNLINNPDVAQPLICTYAALNKKAKFKGLETLKYKETNRIIALKNELKKIGAEIKIENNTIELLNSSLISNIKISTYNDHRMAMCFSPLALKLDEIIIIDAIVVKKSYPEFWKDLKDVGFTISPLSDLNN